MAWCAPRDLLAISRANFFGKKVGNTSSLRWLVAAAAAASVGALSVGTIRGRPGAMSASSPQPVELLLTTCKVACDDVTELVEEVYGLLGKEPGGAVLKEDKSLFSLADGIVQVRVGLPPPPCARRPSGAG